MTAGQITSKKLGQVKPHVKGWRREGGDGGRLPRQGAAFEGRKSGILTFALQCVSVSLYLYLIYSVHVGWALPVVGAAPRSFAPGVKALAPPLVKVMRVRSVNETRFTCLSSVQS